MNHIPEHFRKNIHPKDEKIQFMENDHSYFVDGEKIKFSVSEIIKIHFPEFDSNYWSRIKAIEELENRPEAKNLIGIYSSLEGLTLEKSISEFSGKNF